jgi:hypothetical protein
MTDSQTDKRPSWPGTQSGTTGEGAVQSLAHHSLRAAITKNMWRQKSRRETWQWQSMAARPPEETGFFLDHFGSLTHLALPLHSSQLRCVNNVRWIIPFEQTDFFHTPSLFL